MDSPHWDWFRGYCRLHPGGELPCRVCMETGHKDLTLDIPASEVEKIKADPIISGTFSAQVIRKDGTVEDLGVRPVQMAPIDQTELTEMDFAEHRADFDNPPTLQNGDTLRVNMTYDADPHRLMKQHPPIISRMATDDRPLMERLQERLEHHKDVFASLGIVDQDEIVRRLGMHEISFPLPLQDDPKREMRFVPSEYELVSHFAEPGHPQQDELRASLMAEIAKWGEETVIRMLEKIGYDEEFVESLKSNQTRT